MKFYLLAGSILAMLSVILGAFAAHGLKAKLSEALLNAFTTGVQYQMYHSLALILLVLLHKSMPQLSANILNASAALMLAGIILFSGSLYALAITGIKWFGPITPLGGLCFIAGWAMLVFAALTLPQGS